MSSRLLAILFADVNSSTALYEKLGDRGALAAVESVIGVLRNAAGEALPAAIRDATRDLDAFTIKGKQEAVRVYEVLWQDSGDLTLAATRAPAPASAYALLRIEHSSRTTVMGSDASVLLLGRDAGNQVVIAHKTASRLHGRFERRREKFFYVDLSTNGTYATIEGDAEILLRREELMLRGRGTLAIGHSAADARTELVRFSIA